MRLRKGDVIQAEVVDVKENGLFLCYEGMDGFVNVVNLTWSEIGPFDPSEYARKGDLITVRVYGVLPGCFYASVKDLHPEADPWRDPGRYAEGSRHRGTVHRIASYGAFLLLEGGVVGLLPQGPNLEGLAVGDVVDVVVSAVDTENHRIELERVT